MSKLYRVTIPYVIKDVFGDEAYKLLQDAADRTSGEREIVVYTSGEGIVAMVKAMWDDLLRSRGELN